MNVCIERIVKGCPASLYFKCKAFKDNKSCWEVLDVPCCDAKALEACLRCKVFKKGKKRIRGLERDYRR